MDSIIKKESRLYRFMQWAFFPTPYIIYLLVGNGSSVAITTYMVAVAVGLVFWLAEWLMPFKEHWNHSHDDVANDPPFKFLLLSPIVLLICFWLSNIIRKLPYFKQVYNDLHH